MRIIKDEVQLRLPCKPVSVKEGKEFGRKLYSFLLTHNKKSSTTRAVGIAAPQVGKLITVCVVEDWVMVNPKIISYANHGIESLEGCLSFPDEYKTVWRWEQVSVQCDNWPEVQTFKGVLAIVAQHEIDHLLGTLYFDRVDRDYRNSEGW